MNKFWMVKGDGHDSTNTIYTTLVDAVNAAKNNAASTVNENWAVLEAVDGYQNTVTAVKQLPVT